MLRKFIQCRSNEERLEFVKESNVKDWTSSQLETALEIVGFNKDISNFSDEEKKVTLANVTTTGATVTGIGEKELKVGNNDYNLYRDKSFWLLKVNKN